MILLFWAASYLSRCLRFALAARPAAPEGELLLREHRSEESKCKEGYAGLIICLIASCAPTGRAQGQDQTKQLAYDIFKQLV